MFFILLTLLFCLHEDSNVKGTLETCKNRKDIDFESLSIAAKEKCSHNRLKTANQMQKRKKRLAYYPRAWQKSPDGYVYIPYAFRNLPKNSADAFNEAVARFNNRTCIRLIPRKLDHLDFLEVLSVRNYGCASFVGKKGGKQKLYLETNGCDKPGMAQHEIMHALGFGHTMLRGDWRKFIAINVTNILPDLLNQFFGGSMDLSRSDIYGESFCYESIMMYGRYDFAIDKKIPVITSLDQNYTGPIGQRIDWADCDIQQINRMYRCLDYLTIE